MHVESNCTKLAKQCSFIFREFIFSWQFNFCVFNRSPGQLPYILLSMILMIKGWYLALQTHRKQPLS